MIELQSHTPEAERERNEKKDKLRRIQKTEINLRHIGDILTQQPQRYN